MGRSVSTPSNAEIICYRILETLFLYQCKHCKHYQEAGNGEPNTCEECGAGEFIEHVDEDAMRWEFEALTDDIREQAKQFWPSMRKCDEWIGREDHAILENDFAYMGLSEYCSLVAIWVASKADDLEGSWYSDQRMLAPLARTWINRIEPRFKKLFGQLRKVATASNGETFFERSSP